MAWRSILPSLLTAAVACTSRVAVDDGGGTDGTDGTADNGPDSDPDDDGMDTGTGPGPEDGEVLIPHMRDADILLVVDDSSSMAEAQRILAQDIPTLVDTLDQRGIGYRIAITTTDNGNYWCRGGGVSSPESGNFVFSSCRERIAEFQSVTVDARPACEDWCPAEWSVIEQTPTATFEDPSPRARPWLEAGPNGTNLPAGLDVATALQCLVPQGVSGCGFESHLESMYKGMLRTATESEDEYGFMRDAAALAVLIVTDEADCSNNPDWESIFHSAAEGGNQVFWSLPDEASPTSAVCWNAGVTCSPEGAAVYDDCVPQDKDVDGNDTTYEDAAVLHPVDRYIALMQEIEWNKQGFSPTQEVIVAAIDGVPLAWPNEPITYAVGPNGNDPSSFQAMFGIAEGCTNATTTAVPPVRTRAFAEAFAVGEHAALYSVCSPSYADALEAFAATIDRQLPPGCVPACVADVDAVQEGLQPSCAVTQYGYDAEGASLETNVPPCEPGEQLPASADVCFVLRTDMGGLSPDRADDMSLVCIDEGWNLELGFVRRVGVPAPGGASIGASCQLSQNKAVDCPNLP